MKNLITINYREQRKMKKRKYIFSKDSIILYINLKIK